MSDEEEPAPEVRHRIDEVFERQRRHRTAMAQTTASRRKERIRRILGWTKQHKDAIRRAGYEDFRKPAIEVDLTEIFPVLQEGDHAVGAVKRWMKPKKVRRTRALLTTRAEIRYEPKGLSLIISPWNYPFNLTVVPLISALAAGCPSILKPSEMTPATSALMARMVGELFDDEEVALIEGEVDVARYLLEKPFEHVFFTGSPQVGKIVMKAAAENLANVTLELGGKSPVVVDRSAHVVDAAKKIVWGKWVNQGQTCIAPDYLLVHEDLHDDLLAELGRQIGRFYGQSAEERRASPDLARIVDERHFRRLREMLDESVEAGARVAFGGHRDEEDLYLEPTLLDGVPLDAPAMREEIFGPILPVLSYAATGEALELIRSKEKPLALYVFSRDSAVTEEILSGTSAGGTCVNDVAIHFLHPNLPFGGTGHSGHGSYHGRHGFEAFSHQRSVLHHHRWSGLKLMAPPYDRLARFLSKLTLRFLR